MDVDDGGNSKLSTLLKNHILSFDACTEYSDMRHAVCDMHLPRIYNYSQTNMTSFTTYLTWFAKNSHPSTRQAKLKWSDPSSLPGAFLFNPDDENRREI